MNKEQVIQYYDNYVERQVGAGINLRHHSIVSKIKMYCTQKTPRRILEIGAGVGTLTELLVKEFESSQVVANDISPKSIEQARARLSFAGNLDFLVGDITELELTEKFDLIVLPDVLEHIPLELHKNLFNRLANLIEADGYVFIHIPDPNYLEWCAKNKPELLQVIDQPIKSDVLTRNCYAAGFYLERLESYSIWIKQNDYQYAVLRHLSGVADFESRLIHQSLAEKVLGRVKRIFTK